MNTLFNKIGAKVKRVLVGLDRDLINQFEKNDLIHKKENTNYMETNKYIKQEQ